MVCFAQDEWLESIDEPRHRYGTALMAFWWAWIVADTDKAFFQWLDCEDGNSGVVRVAPLLLLPFAETAFTSVELSPLLSR